MSLLVKICGLSTRETLDVALESGADMVGFVFFPPSPRHLSLEVARELGRVAKGRAVKVALTVDADDATFENIVDSLKPDILQIHGKETTARVRDLKQKFGLPVMKALPVETVADLAALPGYAAVADRILFDARAPKDATRPGGLGATFDWHVLENLDLKLPFMVSGGLHAGNVAEAVRVTRAGGVDVSSGVERSPGIKDPDMIRDFIRAARATHLSSPLPGYGERSDRVSDPGEGESPRSQLSTNLRR
ncbi:MAG: phosphoribosylanthranilate isomerase [Bradyrhizobium sp.]|uniref:phosphoribosylanthranilate isomerase n=1 Tax=Bradyrhizobium sp. TaxID=376 RepID=UPI003D1101DF